MKNVDASYKTYHYVYVHLCRLWEWVKIFYFWVYHHLYPIIKDLDIGEFKDVILVIAAFFVPFAIVFYADLAGKNENRSYFEKLVFSEKVMKTKWIFLAFVGSVSFFAFFSGEHGRTIVNLLSIIFLAFLILFFYGAFTRILKYSEEGKHEFEIEFLDDLVAPKSHKGKKSDRFLNVWNSFWNSKLDKNTEYKFTSIFIKKIDKLLYLKNYDFSAQIASLYLSHIEKRNFEALLPTVLPQVLKWVDLYKKNHKFNCYTFVCVSIFKQICDLTLNNDGRESKFIGIFIEELEKYINLFDQKIQIKYKNEEELFYGDFFSCWCSKLFNVYPEPEPVRYIFLDFPKKWQITSANNQLTAPRKILEEFLRWADDKIFKQADSIQQENIKLANVINYLFPDVEIDLFSAFLALYYSRKNTHEIDNLSQIKSAIFKTRNFNDRRPLKMTQVDSAVSAAIETKTIRINQTILIIHDYFDPLGYLFLYDVDNQYDTDEEFRNNLILNQLEDLKKVLDYEEIKKICEDKIRIEMNKNSLLKLINLLIDNLKKPNS